MSEIVSFDDSRARKYVERALIGFAGDPPDSDYQRGFLAALAIVYREGLGKVAPTDSRIALALAMDERQ